MTTRAKDLGIEAVLLNPYRFVQASGQVVSDSRSRRVDFHAS